jgi:hypothetical protein
MSCTFNSVLLNNSTTESSANIDDCVGTDIIVSHQEEVCTDMEVLESSNLGTVTNSDILSGTDEGGRKMMWEGNLSKWKRNI